MGADECLGGIRGLSNGSGDSDSLRGIMQRRLAGKR